MTIRHRKISRTNEKTATVEEAATVDFAPWVHVEGEWVPPTNYEWSRPHAMMLRVAWTTMFKTKPELIEIACSEMGEEIYDGMVSTRRMLQAAVQLIEAAEARFLCAAAAALVAKSAIS